MSAYLAPRSTHHHCSASLQRRMFSPGARTKIFSSSSKSVRFEDSSAARNTSNSGKTKEKRFHFLRRKKKERGGAAKCSETAVFTPDICGSPSSVRSAPSTVGHTVTRGHRFNSSANSLDGRQSRSSSHSEGPPAGADNHYSLYAVCNHHGTMMGGHYLSYCRNPTDGQWYVFDDSQVQAISEEKLITAGAYLLFYARQSLLSPSPCFSPSSPTSHWAMHIPRFKLDLGGSLGSSDDTHSPSIKGPLSQLGGANSAISPQSLVQDSESDVFLHARGDGTNIQSAPASSDVFLQPMQGHNSSLHHHQLSPSHKKPQQQPRRQQQLCSSYSSIPNHPSHAAGSPNTRSDGKYSSSLRRANRQQHSGGRGNHPVTSDHFYQQDIHFHGSHNSHDTTQSCRTDSGRMQETQTAFPANHSPRKVMVTPSLSIPNITAAHLAAGNQQSLKSLPSRSISNIVASASLSSKVNQTQHDSSNSTRHITNPPPLPPQRYGHTSRSYSVGHRTTQSNV